MVIDRLQSMTVKVRDLEIAMVLAARDKADILDVVADDQLAPEEKVREVERIAERPATVVDLGTALSQVLIDRRTDLTARRATLLEAAESEVDEVRRRKLLVDATSLQRQIKKITRTLDNYERGKRDA